MLYESVILKLVAGSLAVFASKMPAQAALPGADATKLAKWILADAK